MPPASWFVIAIATMATAWLLFYVRYYLPQVLADRYRDSAQAFSKAIELRVPSHAGLTDQVCQLSQQVGMRLGLRPRQLHDLDVAAKLRDIGLCAVPYSLINQPVPVAWNDAELFTYERHAEVSASMLELVPHLSHLAPIVRNHHHEFQALGMEEGVLRSRIPLEASILSGVTAYVWDARYMGDLLAREKLRSGRGIAHDPAIVDAILAELPFLRNLDSAKDRTYGPN